MTIRLRYRCPGTAHHGPHEFTYLHHPSVDADPLPRFCGQCGYDTDVEEPEQVLATPHIGRPIKGVVDGMHRQMEAGAEFRADMAREHFGMDADETRNMLMTDMRDGLRMGDTSNVPLPPSPVSEVMAATPHAYGMQGGRGVEYSGAVASGPFPNAGAHAQNAVRSFHSKFTAGNGQVGATTSTMPALETLSPNYRRRV